MKDIPNEGAKWLGDWPTVTGGPQPLFEVLAVRRRRIALSVLAEREPPINVDSLGQAVAERERSVPNERATHHVRMSLHHAHLPKLADAGLIEYDWERGVVEGVRDGLGPFLNSVDAVVQFGSENA